MGSGLLQVAPWSVEIDRFVVVTHGRRESVPSMTREYRLPSFNGIMVLYAVKFTSRERGSLTVYERTKSMK